MSADLAALDRLARRVMLPLVAGGEVMPILPIGGQLARRLAGCCLELDAELGAEIGRCRLRLARRLCALDFLEPPSGDQWLLLAALNDLVQATNPSLPGWFGLDRTTTLLQMAASLVVLAGPPASVGEALERHATFARLPDAIRIDTSVSWWTGSEQFVGARPPARLLAWPGLRRVQRRTESVPVFELPPDQAGYRALWTDVLLLLLHATPLTDLATMDRSDPPFRWCGTTLGLVRSQSGRRLALRAIKNRGKEPAALQAAERATLALDAEVGDQAVDAAQTLVRELREAVEARVARVV